MITEICNYGDTGQQIVDVVLFDYSDIFEKVAHTLVSNFKVVCLEYLVS